MVTVLLSGVVFLGAAEASITTLDGRQLKGDLQSLSSQAVVVSNPDGSVEYATERLVRIDRQGDDTEPVACPLARIELVDGSVVNCSGVTVQGSQVRGNSPTLGDFVLRRELIRSLRWFDQDVPVQGIDLQDLRTQWQEHLATEALSDRIVIRKSRGTGSGAITKLRVLKGILHQVTDEHVGFEFKQRRIDVPRKEKVEGVIYYHAAGLPLDPAVCTLVDNSGSRIIARDISLVDATIQCRTVGGGDFQLRWKDLRSIDYSQGKIVFLSDLEPESVEWTPFVAARRSKPLLERFYMPRRNQNFEGGPLQLRVSETIRNFDKGLAIHSRSEIVYRLDGQFRRFVALAGIEPGLIPQGNVTLVIYGDNSQLFESTVAGTAEPISLDIDISNVQRLKILVDFGDDLDIADHLILCDGKVTK